MEGMEREKRKVDRPPSPIKETQEGNTPYFKPNRPPSSRQQASHTPAAMDKAIQSTFRNIQDGLTLVIEQGMGCSSVVNAIQGASNSIKTRLPDGSHP